MSEHPDQDSADQDEQIVRIDKAVCPHCRRKVGQFYFWFVAPDEVLRVCWGSMAVDCPYAPDCQGWVVFKNPYLYKNTDRALVPAGDEPQARRRSYADIPEIFGSERVLAELMEHRGMPGAFADYPWA
jgi:hypothetical protein